MMKMANISIKISIGGSKMVKAIKKYIVLALFSVLVFCLSFGLIQFKGSVSAQANELKAELGAQTR